MTDLTTKKRITIFVALMLAVFLGSLDMTVVSTSLITIVKDLKGFDLYTWAFTSYMLMATISMPLFGKLADRFGHKKIYVFGIVVFVLGSCFSGLSQNMMQLIVSRGIQGIGGAIFSANSLALVGAICEPKQRPKYLGIFGTAGALASIIGPYFGGFITDKLSWRWIFYINIPIGILVFLIIIAVLPNQKTEQISKKIDYLGSTALIVGLVPMLLAFTWGGNKYAWSSIEIIGMFILSVVCLTAFYFIEKRADDPIVPLSIFKKADFNIAFVEIFLISAIVIGVLAFVPMYLQAVVGKTASQAGSLLTPVMLSMMVSSILSGGFVTKLGKYKIQVILGLVILTIASVLFSTIGVNTGNLSVIFYMIIIGMGMGLTIPIFNTTAQNAFDESQIGTVSSGVQFARSMGSTIGSAVLGTIVTTSLVNKFADLNTGNIPGEIAGTIKNTQVFSNPEILKGIESKLPNTLLPEFNNVVAQMKQMLCDSIGMVFTICVVISVIAVIIALFMKEKPLVKRQPKEEPVVTSNEK